MHRGIDMLATEFAVRRARTDDALAAAKLLAAVAEEGGLSATEGPVEVEQYAARFARNMDTSVVAYAGDKLVGGLYVDVSKHGFGTLGLLVDCDWRERGIGSALLTEAIDWARSQGLHKLCAETFAHNENSIALYRKFGFVEEGRRARHYRRANGEFWDSVTMGLIL
jgi:RimJ/RimL family protein N-acetyltransferase